MSEEILVIRPSDDEPRRDLDGEMGVGCGWEERGGGFVPEGNPWRADPPYRNPAQDGADEGGLRSDEFQLTPR